VTTVLFPIFASYKALRTSDPAQLTPWLMYWVILSMALLAESTFSFILSWVPMYAWLRLFGHLYLVLPGKQGATQLYQTYVHPFLAEHESDIDKWISTAHESAKAAGLNYLKRFIEWFKVTALGMPPRPRTPPASTQGSYAQQLLSRFNLPSAREGLAAPAGDFYGLLASALQMTSATGASRDMQAKDLSASGTLIPADIHSNEERMNYVSTQRERLRVLLQAFDNEAFNLASAGPDLSREKSTDNLSKSRSEADFDKIEKEEIHGAGKPGQAGWMPWNWAAGKAATPGAENAGHSSGVDLGN
jgi:receptor expression-enhancing protein 1/2/3/4